MPRPASAWPGTTSHIKTWQDLFDKQFIVGGSGAGSQMETMPAMLNKLFGTKIKVISGYKGGNEVYLAMERGEVQGRCGGLISSINSTRPDWFPQKKVAVPIQIALERDPQFPDFAGVGEFAKDERTKQILQLIAGAAWAWTGRSSRRPACRPSASRRCARRSTRP